MYEEEVEIAKTLGTHQPQECSDASLPERKQKHRLKPKSKPASTYNLSWFTLWWNRMERESLKNAAAKKIQCEDITTSAKLRILLGCGNDLSRGGKNLNRAGKKEERDTHNNFKNLCAFGRLIKYITYIIQERHPWVRAEVW